MVHIQRGDNQKNDSKQKLTTAVYRASSTKKDKLRDGRTKESSFRFPRVANCGKVNIWEETN